MTIFIIMKSNFACKNGYFHSNKKLLYQISILVQKYAITVHIFNSFSEAWNSKQGFSTAEGSEQVYFVTKKKEF